MPYAQTLEHFDGDLFVRKASVEYLGSSYDATMLSTSVCTATLRIGTARRCC
jgi:hypothetical protein